MMRTGKKYSVIVVVYNPNSTGKSRQKADDLAHRLRKALPTTKVRVRGTTHAGHAEQITYRTALLSRHALVISVSGDGGYNEVVNGAMRARSAKRRISVGLIPAGNANDHFASRHRGNFVDRVVDCDEDITDVIRVRAPKLTRYGHSYVGLGLTPQASEKLNAKRLNLWQEVKIIISVLIHLKSVRVVVDGEVRHYNSLILSNVGRMSKVIRVPQYESARDGKIEVSHLYHRNKFKLISSMVHAALFGLPADGQTESFTFGTIRKTLMQIDGEVVAFKPGVTVTVDVVHSALHSIV